MREYVINWKVRNGRFNEGVTKERMFSFKSLLPHNLCLGTFLLITCVLGNLCLCTPAVCRVICSSLAMSFSRVLSPMWRVMKAWRNALSPASQCYTDRKSECVWVVGHRDEMLAINQDGERQKNIWQVKHVRIREFFRLNSKIKQFTSYMYSLNNIFSTSLSMVW